jgi:hypothetical protein
MAAADSVHSRLPVKPLSVVVINAARSRGFVEANSTRTVSPLSRESGSDPHHFVVMSMSNTVPLRGTSHVSVELPVRYALGMLMPANAGGSMTLLEPSSSDNAIDTLYVPSRMPFMPGFKYIT